MDKNRLAGRVALVMGGAGGIGAAIALRFAQEGAKVIVADLELQQAESVALRIRDSGSDAIAVGADLTDPESVANAVTRSVGTFARLTTLVNVAAAPTCRGTAETLALEEWNRTLAVNLTGAFLTCKYAVPAMRDSGGGVIINIASQLGTLGAPGMTAYCTSKAALIFFTRMLAVDHACDGIRANSISPGAISTDRLSRAWGGDKEAAAKGMGPRHLLGRLGTAEEVALAASYLASDDASFVTGADLLVDGGYTAFKGTVDENRTPTM
jgi:NAD(P)-dependent dehydrogenase (short-subunit alcohol dehydrogenase family)